MEIGGIVKSNWQRFALVAPNRQTGNSRREREKKFVTKTKIIAVRKDVHQNFFRFNTKIKMVENVCLFFFLFVSHCCCCCRWLSVFHCKFSSGFLARIKKENRTETNCMRVTHFCAFHISFLVLYIRPCANG